MDTNAQIARVKEAHDDAMRRAVAEASRETIDCLIEGLRATGRTCWTLGELKSLRRDMESLEVS